jgi:hypothetical protein
MKATWAFIVKRASMVALGFLIGIAGIWSPDRTVAGLIEGMKRNGLID